MKSGKLRALISEKTRNGIGVSILVLAILASFWNVIFRNVEELTSNQIEIRIGHQELHTGMREAFQAAIEAYQEIHPNVRIIQVPVPPRTYPAWIRTQLVGGTAPDIVGLSGSQEEILEFFLPITDFVDKPNPYNLGTSLEKVRWRDTFFDGMTGIRDIVQESAPGQMFGVMLQTSSMRLYINRDMLIEITGSDRLPQEYNDLYLIQQKIREYNQRTGKNIIPIASCRNYADYTFNRIVNSQTQKFLLEWSPHMRTWGFFRPMAAGVFKYNETPEFLSSLELMHEVAQMLTPGYQQFLPEDAIATYLQQRSLMLVAGSWDYAVLTNRVSFETAITSLPIPSTSDPRYGKFTLGSSVEPVGTAAGLGVIRRSPNADVAVDFLQFLTSQTIAAEFSAISKRLPAVIDVPIPDELKIMTTQIEGEIPGFRVDSFLPTHNVNTLIQQHIHKVTGRQPDIRGFAETIDTELPRYIKEDIKMYHRTDRLRTQKFDGMVVLHYMLPEGHPARSNWAHYTTDQHGAQGRVIEYQHWLDSQE